MIRRPPRSTRTDTLFPYTTLFRSPDTKLRARYRSNSIQFGLRYSFGAEEAPPPEPVSEPIAMVPVEPAAPPPPLRCGQSRSEEHTSELQSLMRISYAVFCLKKKNTNKNNTHTYTINT